MKNIKWMVLVGGLVGAAVAQELRKPPAERTWTGKVGGVVPYDLRPPTVGKLASRIWAPDDPRILVPQAFGVGWTVNLGRLAQIARSAA
jgi:hypothetical protein